MKALTLLRRKDWLPTLVLTIGMVQFLYSGFAAGPNITTQPQSQTVIAGTNVSFSVTATGTQTPFTFQWSFNDTNLTDNAQISGATTNILNLTGVGITNAGNYRVVVTDRHASSTTSSVATLTVLLPPTITAQPQSAALLVGSDVVFNVTAVGTAPLAYQWRFNGSAIPGATTNGLTMTNLQLAAAGEYTVQITNIAGSITSAVATLSFVFPPGVLTSPVDRRVPEGSTTSFTVTTSGTGPLYYQWQKEGTDLADDSRLNGTTNATLTISNLQFDDAGSYRVVVSNAYGVATSAAAALAVATNLPPLSGSIGVWGDYDNDGLMDVLLAGTIQGVPGYPDGRFTKLYHNYGEGIFDPVDLSLPQLDNAAAAWGDYDNDGDLDLLLSGSADGTNGPVNVTEIYRNDGSNQFTKINANLEPLSQGSVAWVDYDNDGLSDIFTAGLNSTTNWVTRIYHNNGDSTFTLTITNLATPQNVRGSWTDCDNDGDADVLLAGSDAVYLFKNAGEGVFTNANISIPSQHRVISPWGDFDGDGDMDFMTSSGTYPSVFNGPDYHPSFTRNDGSGVFNSTFDYSLDMWLFSASYGDIDNSGRACVAVAGWVPLVPGGGVWGSATKVYINLGGSWQEVFTLGGWDNRSETWVDYDGDGDLDIFTTGAGLTTFWNNTVALHRDFPQAPLNPAATFTALDAVTLAWNSPAGTPATGRGLSYNVRVGHTPGGSDVVSPLADAATGRRLVQTAGNAGTAHVFKLNNVPPGNYYWSVQSIGQSYTGSPFTAEGMFTVTSSPPVIVTQPIDLSVLSDSNAVFAATVIGTKPLRCQWRKDGVPLSDNGTFSGCTSLTLSISNAQPNLSGAYDLVITNNYGSVTSLVATLTVHGEPRITSQPASQYGLPTRNVSFTVAAAGVNPLGYQWFFNGNSLAESSHLIGTTTPLLTVSNLQAGDAGNYTVVITNVWGAITSSVATLSLGTFRYVNVNNPSPSAPYTSWATAATVIQDAVDAAGPGDEIQVTNGVYSNGGAVGPYQAGNRVYINKPVTVVSVNGPSVTTIIGYAAPLVSSSGQRCAYVGSGATLAGFTLTQGRAEFTTSWLEHLGGGVWCGNGGVVSNCYVFGNRAGENGGGIIYGKAINCLIAGNYSKNYGGGASLCELVNCTIVGNTIGSTPSYGGGAYGCSTKNSIITGNSAANGPNYYSGNLDYCCTTPLPGGTGNFTNDPALINYAGGNYRLQNTSPCINAGDNAAVQGSMDLDGHPRIMGGIVDVGAYEHQPAPWIFSSPTNQSAIVFSNATLSVIALGDAPLAYRWQKNGMDISDDGRITGSTAAALMISPVNVLDAGNYQVFVTNSLGGATSSVAALTILGPPIISTQPVSRTAPAGTNVSFSVTASGLAALSYQWRFAQAGLPGRTNASLSLTNVQAANAGYYDVVITNVYGAITSSVATLTVTPAAPVFVTQAVASVVSVGQNVAFSVAVKGTEPMSCQWQREGTNIPGANSFTLVLSNVNSSFTGNYRAAVSNEVGQAIATNAALVVSPVWMWGQTNNPQLLLNASVPASVTNVLAIAAAPSSDLGLPCMALRADGSLATWGYFSRDPAPPAEATNLLAISLNGSGSTVNNLVLRADGTMFNWNSKSQSPTLSNVNVVAIAAGGAHQLALQDDGTVLAWGVNTYGVTNVPAAATNIIAIAAGWSHNLALRADGTVIGWGLNTSGQATALSNAVNVVAIAAGGNQSLALLADGTVIGRIVTNTPGASVIYGPPTGDISNKTAIAAGSYHSLAINADRTVTGWGATNYGKINIPSALTNVFAIAAGGSDSLALVDDPFAPPTPPRIGRMPSARAIMAGQAAVFNALAVGGPSLSYRWYHNGVLLPGQNKASLVFTNVLPSDAGDYQLVISNRFGSITGLVAAVTVNLPPPVMKSVFHSDGAFSFTVDGIAGVLYIVEYRDALDTGTWTELASRLGDGSTEIIADTNAVSQTRFYRIRAVYPPPP